MNAQDQEQPHRTDGWRIVDEYCVGFAENSRHWFRFEMTDIVEMFSHGDITEDRFRECLANLRRCYVSPSDVDEDDD